MASILRDIFAGPPPVAPRRWGSATSDMLGIAPSYATADQLASDPSRGLAITTAWACVRLIAGVSSSLPNRILKRGDRQRVEQRQPEFAHLWNRPNPVMTRQVFWESLVTGALTYGNGYAWKGRNEPVHESEPWRGVTELYPLSPARVQTGVTSDWRKMHVIDRDTEDPHATDEVGHVPLMSLDGVIGLSPIKQNAAALGLAQAMERFGATFFSRGQQVSGILTSDQVIDQDAADQIADRWMERHSGTSTSLRPAVLGRGAEWKPIAIPPDEAQFIQSRGYQREEMVQIYGVPPHMIGLVEKSTSWGAGVEWQYIGFVVTCLVPLLNRFEQWVSTELLPPELDFRFALQGLLRGDSAGRAELYSKLRLMGVMSADTILELEDLAPRGIQDDYLSPSNMERLPIPDSGPVVRGTVAARALPGRPIGPETTPSARFGALDGVRREIAPEARDVPDLVDAIAEFLAEHDDTQRVRPTTAPPLEPESESHSLTEQMARAFLEGASYGQVAIQFRVDGDDPIGAVKQRLRRHFGGSPNEARREYLEGVGT